MPEGHYYYHHHSVSEHRNTHTHNTPLNSKRSESGTRYMILHNTPLNIERLSGKGAVSIPVHQWHQRNIMIKHTNIHTSILWLDVLVIAYQ